MIRGVNKRGQREMSLGTLLAIILGVVVVVVLILFFTGSLDKLTGARDALPGQVEAIAQSCKLSVEASLITDYCYNFKDADNDEYINCQDARIKSSLEQQEVGLSDKIECDSDKLIWESKANICAGLSPGARADVFFNGARADNCGTYYDSKKGEVVPYDGS